VAYETTPALVAPAGAGRYTRELGRALARRPDLDVRALSHLGSRRSGGTARRVLGGLERELLHFPLAVGRRARAAGAQVLHCSGPFWARSPGMPVVLTLHDVLAWRYPELFTRVNVAHQRLVVARAARRAARVLVGSRHTGREVSELLDVPAERIDVTPYGVDPRFRPTLRDPAWLAARFGVDRPYVLAVGTLEPRKNLGTLARALARAQRDVPPHALVLVGARGWRAEGLERELAASGVALVRTGRVDDEDLVRLYGGAACFAFPSLYEGFGFPVLEAMACGAPVVAADRTSIPEVAGDAAVLVDPRDEAALAGALLGVLGSRDGAAELRRRGLAHAAAFTWERCADLTAQGYRSALDSRA
jgi:alpha-1,3-rhamnosyl/mannosyltransferase